MATKFSPCKGSYVLNQFPSNVMFGMNGFHVSASGAIQGHHGPLVVILKCFRFGLFRNLSLAKGLRRKSLKGFFFSVQELLHNCPDLFTPTRNYYK